MSLGVDLHPYYQRSINWQGLANATINGSRVDYGWVKVSDGGAAYTKTVSGVTYYPSTMVNGLKGVGRKVGAYHYAQPSPDPETQADILLREARRLGAMDLAPMLDLEAPFAADNAAKAFAIRFLKRVAAAGVKPGVYMSASFAKTLRPDQWGIPNLVIWIARYGAKPEAAGSAQYLGRYDVHQYSSTEDLAGLTDVDVNWAYTTNHYLMTGDEDLTPEEHNRQIWIEQALRTVVREVTGNLGGDPSFDSTMEFVGPLDGFPSLINPSKRFTPAAFQQYIDQHTGQVLDKVNILTDLLAKQNGVTADDIAAALRTGLVADLLPVLHQVLADALGEDNGEQAATISDAVLAKLGQKLTGGTE